MHLILLVFITMVICFCMSPAITSRCIVGNILVSYIMNGPVLYGCLAVYGIIPPHD